MTSSQSTTAKNNFVKYKKLLARNNFSAIVRASFMKFPQKSLLFAFSVIIVSALSQARLLAQLPSQNSDPSTAMTTDAGEAINDTDPPNNEDVPGDPGYVPPPPNGPDTPDTGGNYEGPVGVTGIFNGNVTTGCSYDPLSHSAHRVIDDIVVPGSIGKYPLKMTRYYNGRQQYYALGAIALSPGWAHEYSWLLWGANSKVVSPHGSVADFFCGPPVGTSERWEGNDWRLADGGRVHYDPTSGRCTWIEDPYGQRTNITYTNSQISRVTEPGGRYLQFTYGPTADPDGTVLLTRVEAHGLGDATVTDWVNYTYSSVSPGVHGREKMMLTRADYPDSNPNNLNDNTHAHYGYAVDNVAENQTTHKMYPVLQRCDDVRYSGPMRTIRYEYQNDGPHGAIINEKYPGIGAASAITPGTGDMFTETRGDGPTRSFTYSHMMHCQGTECTPCDDYENNEAYPYRAPQQMLLNYTDFKGKTTTLAYDPNWYVNSVTDANTHTTYYERGTAIGEITKITHPDATYIQYIYESTPQYPSYDPHHVISIRDERGNKTVHTRDANHRITRTDYKDAADNVLAYETFTYNSFGQILNHRLKNNAYERFAYDTRGLLTDKWNPKQDSVPLDSDPHTHYDYYGANDVIAGNAWIDRVKKMTLPANVSNNVATETYQYDRNTAGQAVPGRGLVTKITHADGKFTSASYSQFGNKMWEENELRQRTTSTYDNYNRVLSIKNPLNKVETFDYLKPGTTSSYLHTTNSVYSHTSRTGIITTNLYDQNWRKTSTTTSAATTQFAYDDVGNLKDVTDPRTKITHNVYDNRNRKTATTEAWGVQGQAATTVWHYNPVGSITQIDRPDGQSETKVYDALNRMIRQTVPRQVLGGNQVSVTTNSAYNPSGTIHDVTDPMGHHTTFDYDASDRKTTMTYDGGSSHQSWAYDDAGNLKSRTTVNNETQTFQYDIRNHKISMNWSNGVDSAIFSYDDAGRLLTANNANSNITRSYNSAGWLTVDQQTPTGVPGGAKSVNYFYDDDGKVNRMYVASASYDYTFTYDSMGRFEKIFATSNLNSPLFEYDYDLASNETDRHNYFNNVNIEQIYSRDSLNRISSRLLKRNGQSPAFSSEAYTYDHMNRITDVNRGNGADHFAYYWTGELETADYGGQPHMPFQEGQDPDLDTADNVDVNGGYVPPDTAETEPTAPPDDYSDPAVGGFVPPDLPGGRSVAYYLDKAGNRQQMNDSVNGNPTYARNNLNQYTAITGVTGSTIANGNEHQVSSYKTPSDTQQVNYAYLNDEHLISATSGSNTYLMSYDALGRCVKRSLNGSATYYIYDGEKPVVEYGPNSAVAKNLYGKGIDEILMRTDTTVNGGNAFYYGQDHEGSVTHLLNASGNVIESYLYDAFGTPTMYDGNGNHIDSTAYNNRFLFTGREYAATYQKTYVANFGFYEYRARAYHPTLGRFMSEDPKLFVHRAGFGKAPDDWTFGAHPDEAEFNLFRYCGNDPLDFTDPMGLDTYTQDREIIFFGVAPLADPTGEHIATHTFVFTTNPDGSVSHTYSWGNAANPRGWNIDQREDKSTAEQGLRKDWAKKEGDSRLDRQVQKAFDQLNNKNNEHANGWIRNNCKDEAQKLLNKARELQKQEQQKASRSELAPTASDAERRGIELGTQKAQDIISQALHGISRKDQ